MCVVELSAALVASTAPSFTNAANVMERASPLLIAMCVILSAAVKLTRQLAAGMIGKVRVTCPDCAGEGEKLREKDMCKKCHGKKVSKVKKRVEFMIEPGTLHGERIALKGEADEAVGRVKSLSSLRSLKSPPGTSCSTLASNRTIPSRFRLAQGQEISTSACRSLSQKLFSALSASSSFISTAEVSRSPPSAVSACSRTARS